MRMKVEHLRDILISLAQNHPEADVCISYPSRHAGRPTTKRGDITGHRTFMPSHPALSPTVFIEVEHSRSENINDD